MLRVKEMHDKIAAQAADLEVWNKTLERRVADQLSQIERVSRLKRLLAPQIAELIVADSNERVLQSHRRDETCAASRVLQKTRSPKKSSHCWTNTMPIWVPSFINTRGLWNAFQGMGSWSCLMTHCLARILRCAR